MPRRKQIRSRRRPPQTELWETRKGATHTLRDIYLVDFENVASEGLNGITQLEPEDQVVIFYSNNSKSLSMKMHILIGKSNCQLDYFEVSVGGKNALDHQVSTWLGYLVATKAAERNYYIVSRDAGYKFVASFWTDSEQKPNVRCVDSIKTALRQERSRVQQEAAQRAEEPEIKTAEPEEFAPEMKTETAPQHEPEQHMPELPIQEGKEQKQAKKQQNRKKAQNQKKTEEPKTPQCPELGALIAPYPGLPEGRLRELIAENKKQALCNTLRKQLGQEKGLALYNEIKKSVWK